MIKIAQAQIVKQVDNIQVWETWVPKRGDIYYCDLDGSIDSEQKGIRPVVILSNNKGNFYSSIVVVAPITSKKKHLPRIHVSVGKELGLKIDSYALTEHIRTVSKRRFFINDNYPTKIITLPKRKMIEIEESIKYELGFIS